MLVPAKDSLLRPKGRFNAEKKVVVDVNSTTELKKLEEDWAEIEKKEELKKFEEDLAEIERKEALKKLEEVAEFEKNHLIEDLKRLQRKVIFSGKDVEIKEKDTEIKKKDAEIKEKDAEIKEKDAEIKEKDAEIKEKDAEIKEREKEINKLKKKMAVLRARCLNSEMRVIEFEISNLDLEAHIAKWESYSMGLKQKIEEATKRHVSVEGGVSQVVLTLLSTMSVNGMNVGLGGISREADRLLHDVKSTNGFKRGFCFDVEHGVGDIEIGRAKRRRIFEEDIDEDRFYENHAGDLDFQEEGGLDLGEGNFFLQEGALCDDQKDDLYLQEGNLHEEDGLDLQEDDLDLLEDGLDLQEDDDLYLHEEDGLDLQDYDIDLQEDDLDLEGDANSGYDQQ